jgi:hypothetical protein
MIAEQGEREYVNAGAHSNRAQPRRRMDLQHGADLPQVLAWFLYFPESIRCGAVTEPGMPYPAS